MGTESISLSIWFLMGAILVFFMQSGFAMVEWRVHPREERGQHHYEEPDGFLHWSSGFLLLGYGLLTGPHVAGGFIGTPTLAMFGGGFSSFDWSSFVFQLVFCATCATIVSGARRSGQSFQANCLTRRSSAW